MAETSTQVDCLVVGGGLLGMLSAYFLRKGGLSVALLERRETGREASWAGGGILSPLAPWRHPDAISELVAWSQRFYPGFAEELLDATGIDPEWIQSGMLVLDVRLDSEVSEWAVNYRCPVETVDPEQVHRLEPEVAAVTESALWLPGVAQIRNPQLCAGLARLIQEQGVDLYEQTEVLGLTIASNRIQGVETNQGRFSAGNVVIAGGAWSSLIMQQSGLALSVTPVRGQMLAFDARPGLLRHIVLRDEYYLIPRQDGLVLAGSTLEYVGYNKETSEEARETLTEMALKQVPALSDYEVVKQWAGLRPGTTSGYPFIGEHPEIQGLYLNTGHFRNGVVMAPASAQLLLDCMLKRDSFTPLASYAL